jgi:hypothetical protein
VLTTGTLGFYPDESAQATIDQWIPGGIDVEVGIEEKSAKGRRDDKR